MWIIGLIVLSISLSLYFAGYSAVLVFAIPAGCVALWLVFRCFSLCHRQDMYERQGFRRDYANERTHLLPSHLPLPPAKTLRRPTPPLFGHPSPFGVVQEGPNEWTRLPSSHKPPPPAETLRRPASTLFSHPSTFGAAPKVSHTQPSASLRVAAEPRILRYTTSNYPSPATDTRRPLNTNPTLGSLSVVPKRQPARTAQTKPRPASKVLKHIPLSEIDGILLHESVTEEIGSLYPYDQKIKTDDAPYSTVLSVAGVFKCYNCKRKKDQPEEPRIWTSNGICVEIWMSSPGHRYRTRLNSQECMRCRNYVEPEPDNDDYVTKVVRVLDRWTGQRSVVKPLRHHPPTGPHKTEMCYGCRKGVCPQRLPKAPNVAQHSTERI